MWTDGLPYELPYPPSVNLYWRHVIVRGRIRVLLAAAGRRYRTDVAAAVLAQGRVRYVGRLALTIDVYPPDRRVRDLDNLLKGPLDAMRAIGLYEDDSQIDGLHVRRREVAKGGALMVWINPVKEE